MLTENNITQLQDNYIQLTKEYYDQDRAGRYTTIDPGSYGMLIDSEKDIDTIWDITPRQKESCLALFRSAKKLGHHFALVAGYPCVIGKEHFIRKKPISSIVPWEII